jgi:hypothetical protein
MINAPFNSCRLFSFDIVVHIYLNPTGSRIAFNPLAPLMINLLRVGSLPAASLRSGAPIAQAPASERGAAPGAQKRISPKLGNPVEQELSGGRSRSYKITRKPPP